MNRRKYKKKCKREITNQMTIEDVWVGAFKRMKEVLENLSWEEIVKMTEEREKMNEQNEKNKYI